MENKIETKREYYENGQLQCEWPMLNGERHGIQKWWWDNGNIQYIYLRVNGQVQGIIQYWNYHGTIDLIRKYKNNNQHGPKIIFKYGKYSI